MTGPFTVAPSSLPMIEAALSLIDPAFFDGAEDLVVHTCGRCSAEFDVLCAEVDGVWTMVGADTCPTCSYSGTWIEDEPEWDPYADAALPLAA